MSRAIGRRTLKEIRSLLVRFDNSVMEEIDASEIVRAIENIDCALAPRRSVVAAKVRRVEKQKTRRDEWCAVRAQVLARANGACENCGNRADALSADHMFGGFGRRQSLESRFSVWGLCSWCDRAKTMNDPNAAHWLGRFLEHCDRRHRAEYADPAHEGYRHAANIAQARLDSLELQGRAGGTP